MRGVVMGGFRGAIYPINPRYDSIMGRKAYASILDVPDPKPDVAFIVVPARQVMQVLSECAIAGVKCCIVESAGFAEVGPEGLHLEQELVAECRRSGIRLIGPNCLGMLAPPVSLHLGAGSTLFEHALEGPIALACQSGSLMMGIYHRGVALGYGFSCCVSVGNQADIDISELIAHWARDPGTRVVCAYVEGVKDPSAFLAAVEQCRKNKKPVIVLKAGQSAEGATVASSHTASLAGSAQVFAAYCRQAGVLLVDDPDTLIALAGAVAYWPRPVAKTVAVLSGSGGGAAVLTDRLRAADIEIAELGPEQRVRLEALVVPVIPGKAIVDFGRRSESAGDDYISEVTDTILGDPRVGAAVLALTVGGRMHERACEIAEVAARVNKLLVVTMFPDTSVAESTMVFTGMNFPCVARTDEAVRLVTAWLSRAVPVQGSKGRRRIVARSSQPPSLDLPGLPGGFVSEWDAKQLLSAYGIPITAGGVVSSLGEAEELAEVIGYPVALKAASRDISHKTDIGAVELGVGDADALGQAWRRIMRSVAREAPSARVSGCYIQEMTDHTVEVILGIRRDDQFGPVVVVGTGGVLTEVVRDVQVAPAPIDRATARGLVSRLTIAPVLLGAARGRGVDVEALIDTIVTVGGIAEGLGERLVDLEINPLGLWLGRPGVKVLDARGVLAEPAPRQGGPLETREAL